MRTIFVVFIAPVIILLLFHVLGFLATRRVGYLPSQASNLCPLHWKAKA